MSIWKSEKRFVLKEWHKAIKEWEYIVHETKKKVLFRFLLVFGIVIVYLLYVTHRFGGKNGLLVTLLTWSFFVLCTPIADAGILIDFPVRLVSNVRMLFSEMSVWVVAISINTYALLTNSVLYEDTVLLKLFHHILVHPWPFWMIILLSALGTFLSILFADELVDVAEEHHRHLHKRHRMKLKIVIMLAILFFVFILYDFLLTRMGVTIPLL